MDENSNSGVTSEPSETGDSGGSGGTSTIYYYPEYIEDPRTGEILDIVTQTQEDITALGETAGRVADALGGAPAADAEPETQDGEGEDLPETLTIYDAVNQIAVDVRQGTDRPFLTTPFSEYSVSEGLMLGLLMVFFGIACGRLIREAFSWLK